MQDQQGWSGPRAQAAPGGGSRLRAGPAGGGARRGGRLRQLLGAAVVAAFAVGFAAGPGRAETTAYKNFTLIDGSGAAAAPHAAMIVTDGRIAWVGPAARLHAPAGASQVDLAGKYVMPGLIDLHVHLGDVVDMVQDKKFFTRQNVEHDLRTYAAYGVTTVQSLGTDGDLIFALRDAQRAGRPQMARIYTAGQGFVFKGGYGGLAGVNPPISSPSQAAPRVAAQAAKHVDLIKFWLDSELGAMPKMPPDITLAIITAAHSHGLKTVAHIFYLADARRVVDQGVDGLAHSVRDQPVDQALIEDMRRRGTWQMAETLSREASMFAYADMRPFLSDPFFTKPLSPATIAVLSDPAYARRTAAARAFPDDPKFLATAEQNLMRLARAGVPYGFGTDAGPPGRLPGYAEHWELELMVKAGLTPSQTIVAATSQSAAFLHASDLGALKAGKWADFVVLTANPLTNIRNTRAISAVFVAGNKVKSINEY